MLWIGNSAKAMVSDEDVSLGRLTWYHHSNAKGEYMLKRIKYKNAKYSVLLHRMVVERMIGRELTRADVVLAKDGNYLNCQRDNLYLKGNE